MALQDLCLTAIVEDFEVFYTAFTTTKDENLKRKFEFLQRVYSSEIAKQIYEECEMEEKYTDLLINKYMKILDTNWFNNCSWKTVITKMAEVGPSIKKMIFHECYENRPWQEIFYHLPNLEVMNFCYGCDDEILSSIARFCPNIIEIDIRSSSNVSGDGLKHLCKQKNGKPSCPKLKKLVMTSCDITEETAKCLIKNLPSLEFLDYYDLPLVIYSLHSHDLPSLDKIQLYNLNVLDFSSCSLPPNFTDLFKVCLTLCPYLTSLSCPIREPQQLDLLAGLSHLEVLHIMYEKDDYLVINNLLKSQGSKLTSLSVFKCSLSVLTLAKSCPSLKKLSLSTVSFEHYEGSVPLFHNLDAFKIENVELCNDANNLKSLCLIWSLSPKLEAITFKNCSLDSTEVKSQILKSFEHSLVKEIDFKFCYLDKQFILDILLTCHSLKSLDLTFGCDLDGDEADEVRRCSEILPNRPEVFFSDDLSVSDYDDFLDDYYDNDLDDTEDYEVEYYDYLHGFDEEGDYDGMYGFF